MNRRVRLVGLVFTAMILLAVPASNAVGQTERATDFIHQLDQDMPGLLRSYHVPGTTVAMVEHGAVVWAKGYGMADVSAGTAVTSDTVFQAASTSKAVTAWGVMRLVEQGKLDLDSPA